MSLRDRYVEVIQRHEALGDSERFDLEMLGSWRDTCNGLVGESGEDELWQEYLQNEARVADRTIEDRLGRGNTLDLNFVRRTVQVLDRYLGEGKW